MEIKKYIFVYAVLINLIFCYNQLDYKIKYFGIYIADCKITKKDTIFYNSKAKKITFKVQTKNFFKHFFPLENIYSIILNKANNILFFKKETKQPRLLNSLETELKFNRVFYKGTDREILKNYYNIFSLLDIIMSGENVPEKFFLEREGAVYNASLKLEDNNVYELYIDNNSLYEKLIEKTDIFSWALFLDNGKRKIFVDQEKNIIEKCIFSRGVIRVTATLDAK